MRRAPSQLTTGTGTEPRFNIIIWLRWCPDQYVPFASVAPCCKGLRGPWGITRPPTLSLALHTVFRTRVLGGFSMAWNTSVVFEDYGRQLPTK